MDLGTNELWFSEIDTAIGKIIPSGQGKLSMAEGAGPRHLAFHPTNKWIYVVNELDCTVSLITQSKDGLYNLVTSYSTLPENFTDENYCADIHITSDGKFIYASNRGHNSIVIYEVNQMNGSLKLFGHESTYEKWPRNFFCHLMIIIYLWLINILIILFHSRGI